MVQSTKNNKLSIPEMLGKNWIALFLVVLVIVFSLLAPAFFSIDTLQLIFFNGTEVFLLGAAELFVIITGGIDLSVGFIMGFSTIMCSKLIVMFQGFGFSAFASILAGSLFMLAIGLLPGLVNGWLVAYLRVPAFIATFSMLGITHGISELMTQGVPTKNLPSLAGVIGNGSFLYISPDREIHFFARPQVARGQIVVSILPNMAVFAFIFILMFSFLLSKTKFGRHLYAIGGNIDAAIRSGINVKRDLLKAYMISSFFASLAGISYVMKYITGKPDAGADLLLDSIAAVVIGGASMAGGSGTMGRTILGALVIAVVQTGLRIVGMQTFMTYILVGSILIITVILDQVFPNFNR